MEYVIEMLNITKQFPGITKHLAKSEGLTLH